MYYNAVRKIWIWIRFSYLKIKQQYSMSILCKWYTYTKEINKHFFLSFKSRFTLLSFSYHYLYCTRLHSVSYNSRGYVERHKLLSIALFCLTQKISRSQINVRRNIFVFYFFARLKLSRDGLIDPMGSVTLVSPVCFLFAFTHQYTRVHTMRSDQNLIVFLRPDEQRYDSGSFLNTPTVNGPFTPYWIVIGSIDVVLINTLRCEW